MKFVQSIFLLLVALVLLMVVPATTVGNFAQAKQAAREVQTAVGKFFAGLLVSYRVRVAPWAQVFQSAVALNQGFGVVGEIAFEGPLRATPGVIKGADPTLNIVGRAFTIDTADGQYTAGGTGVFGGILANPKTMSSLGTSAGGALAPTLTVPNGTIGEFVTMGEIVIAAANAAKIGDKVMFAQATGIVSALPPLITYTGEIAVTTGILTVSGASVGANLSVGMAVLGTGVPAGTIITALGTGTGGDGTYQTNIATAVASFADGHADNVAPAGSTVIEGAKIERYTNAAAGLAVAQLNG